MRQVRYIRIEGGKPPNPFVQFLGFITAAAVFVVSVLIGGIVLAALVGFVLLAVLVIYVRVWWMRRKLGTEQTDATVDAEYHVIDISEPDETGGRDRHG